MININQNIGGQHYFTIKAPTGEIICTSEKYQTKLARDYAISLFKDTSNQFTKEELIRLAQCLDVFTSQLEKIGVQKELPVDYSIRMKLSKFLEG